MQSNDNIKLPQAEMLVYLLWEITLVKRIFSPQKRISINFSIGIFLSFGAKDVRLMCSFLDKKVNLQLRAVSLQIFSGVFW